MVEDKRTEENKIDPGGEIDIKEVAEGKRKA